MARIRTVKPEFFKNYKLYKAEQDEGLPLRLGFEGLWTVADREGRFEWIPEQIKLDVLPYDHVDFGDVLDALERHGYVLSYEVDGQKYGVIPKFREHQVVNQREAQSKLPPPPDDLHVHAHAQTGAAQYVPSGSNVPTPLRQTVYARDGNRCVRCGATDDLTIDHIFPQSIGGTHALENLRTLCRPCNSGRPVAGQGLIDDLAKDGLALSDMQRICMHMHAHVERKGKEGKGREQADGAGAPAPARRKKSDSMTVDDFIAECKTNGEQAIPDDDPVIAYCTDAGIPHEFVYLAWREFVDRYRASGKRQKGVRGWRQTFLNCVRGNWYELWAIGNDGYFLTKQGKQAQLAHKEAA